MVLPWPAQALARGRWCRLRPPGSPELRQCICRRSPGQTSPIIDCHATNIHADSPPLPFPGVKWLLGTRHGIVKLQLGEPFCGSMLLLLCSFCCLCSSSSCSGIARPEAPARCFHKSCKYADRLSHATEASPASLACRARLIQSPQSLGMGLQLMQL